MEELRAKLLIESHSRASGQRASHTSAHQAPPVWRAPEGSTAVPVGGGGAWPGFETKHKHTSAHQTPPVWRAPEGSTAVPVGGGGAWPGFRATRQPHPSTPGPTGVEGAGGTGGPGCGAGGRWRGLAGLRGDAPSEARSADGSRAGRRPPAHTAAGPSGARNTSGTTSNTTQRHHAVQHANGWGTFRHPTRQHQ